MKKTFDVKRLTTLALLTTIALTIFVVESAYNNGFTNWPRRGQNRINTAWEASNDYWYPNY